MKKIFGVLHILSRIYFLLLLLSCTAFVVSSGSQAIKSENEKIVTDSCQFLGATLRLVQEGDPAYLEAEDPNRTLRGKLKITPPCYFLRSEGKLETYAYKDIGIQGVLMIIGKIADVELKKYLSAPEDAICGEENQGILFKKKYIVLTERIGTDGLFCKDYGTDEKEYRDFAYRK